MALMKRSKDPKLTELKRYIVGLIGATLYAIGLNLFVVPAQLYDGGLMGFCQLFRTLLITYAGIDFPFDIAGILFGIVNIPIIIIAWIHLEHRFVIRTLVNVLETTVLLSAIPVRSIIAHDLISECLIGGVLCGVGTGITLWAATATGGIDVIAFLLMRTHKNLSVGKLNIGINLVLYTLYIILFSVQTAIYSIVFAAIYSIAADKLHQQNINVEAMIVANQNADEMKQALISVLDRGVTVLPAQGGYTGDPKTVFYILCSKYEVPELTEIAQKYDENALISIMENAKITGNFLKRL